MSEKQLSDHHGAISLDLVATKVQVLKTSALSQGLGQVLSSLTLYFVTLYVKSEETVSSAQ